MLQITRVLVAVAGIVMLLGGLAAMIGGLRLEGLYVAALGAAGLLVVFFERQRYGHSPEERRVDAETHRPTDEVFVDPTTGQRTRVWFDPQSGERSYRHE